MLEVEARFTQSSLHIYLGKWLAFFMDKPPQDGAAAIDVPARHHLATVSFGFILVMTCSMGKNSCSSRTENATGNLIDAPA